MNGVIKVADFGLTEDTYGTNYYRRSKSDVGAADKVPIRWMAPESIENNIYNQSTDVVGSFVLLGERTSLDQLQLLRLLIPGYFAVVYTFKDQN